MKSPIERREFGKVILSSALSAAAAGAQTPKPRSTRPWPPGIKISVQMPNDLSDEDLQFVNQLGCRYVNIPTSGRTATYENFIRLKNKVETAGLLVWNIGNSDVHNMEEVTLNLPGRDKKIEEYKNFIRNLGRAGLHYTTYAHMGNGIWSSGHDSARGGAAARVFDIKTATGHWGGKEFKGPLTHGRVFSEKEIWDNYEYFIRQVVPVAEEQGIFIGIHPDDPPVPMLGGVPRCIFGNFEGYKRALEIANSPNVGVCLCCGTWMEGGELMGMDVVGAIHYFAKLGKAVEDPFPQRQRAGAALRGGICGQRLHGYVEGDARAARGGVRRRGDRRSLPANGRRQPDRGGLHGRLHEGAALARQRRVRGLKRELRGIGAPLSRA